MSGSPLDAFAARLEPEVRNQGPDAVLGGLKLNAKQLDRLADLVARYEALHEKAEQAHEQLERERKEIGPDSPQMEGMEMREAGIDGAIGEGARRLVRVVFLEVLTEAQLVDWLLATREDE